MELEDATGDDEADKASIKKYKNDAKLLMRNFIKLK